MVSIRARMPWSNRSPNRPWTTSRPRRSIAKSADCRAHSDCRSCSATLKASRLTRQQDDCDVPPARSAAV